MNLIVAADQNWGIGLRGELLVRIPLDQKYFRELTMGGVVLAGRRTMESIPGGTTLKGRTNIVLTSQRDYIYSDAIVVHDMKEALEQLSHYPDEKIFIIGGGTVYREFLPYCTCAYVTRIQYAYEADAYFPDLDSMEEWEMTHSSEEQTYYDLEYYFTRYRRIK